MLEMKTYEHTQSATTILWAVGVLFLITLAGAIVLNVLLVGAALMLITAWLFRSMTVEISDADLSWCFGSGWLRKSVPLNEIVSAEVIRTTFFYGWGIHYTPRGWLYNVSGYGAVAITLRNGKRFCLGSDEPEKLVRCLASRR
jgi:hypothetical protein